MSLLKICLFIFLVLCFSKFITWTIEDELQKLKTEYKNYKKTKEKETQKLTKELDDLKNLLRIYKSETKKRRHS